MSRIRVSIGLAFSALIAACSSAGAVPESTVAKAPSPPPPVPQEEPTTEAAPPERMPDACDQAGGDICTPPPAFARGLCKAPYPDVALAMFAKSTPWTRAYVTHEVEAWNAAGGRATSAKMSLGEEVLVIVRRQQKGVIQIGANGNYDVLRWDGSCASLMSDEVTMKHPSKPKAAPIRWRSLDIKVRDSLLADSAIAKTDEERRTECSSSTGGEPSPACTKADARLSAVIVDRIRGGLTIPVPEHLLPRSEPAVATREPELHHH